MAVANSSGRDVEYEVQPSNPGGNLTTTIGFSTGATALGTALTAYGCLADGGRGVTVLGLFLLAAALVADVIALNRSRSGAASFSSGGGGSRTLIAHGATHAHTFTAGTWVVFYEIGQDAPIAQSPTVFDDVDCTVMLRQCPPPQDGTLLADAKTFVEVIPSAT